MHRTILAQAAALAWLAAGSALAAPSAGLTYFERNCASCHTVDPKLGSRAGPGLYNVVGRKAGSVAGFNYTDALARAGTAGKTWTREELDVFLRDPNKDVPGTAMPIAVTDAKSRAEVIGYLATLSGKAAAPAPQAAAAGGDKAGDKAGDQKGTEKKPETAEPKSPESKSESKPAEAKPSDARPADIVAPEPKSGDTKTSPPAAGETKPAEGGKSGKSD